MSDVQPTIRDYPDFMIPNGAASAALYAQGIAQTNFITVGPFDVSSWPIIQILVSIFTGPVGVWTAQIVQGSTLNNGLLTPISDKVFYFNNWNPGYFAFPSYGAQAFFQITPPSLVVPWSGYVIMTARQGQIDGAAPLSYQQTVTGVLGAGAAITTPVTIMANCEAWLTSRNAAIGPSNTEIRVMNPAGTFTMFENVTAQATEASVGKRIWLPPGELQISRQNLAGAAQQVAFDLQIN